MKKKDDTREILSFLDYYMSMISTVEMDSEKVRNHVLRKDSGQKQHGSPFLLNAVLVLVTLILVFDLLFSLIG